MKLKYVLAFTAIIALTSFCSAQDTTTPANTSKTTSSGSPSTTRSPSSSPTSGKGSATVPAATTGYTSVPTADATDIENLPAFKYNLKDEEKPVRENICLQNENYCLTSCGGSGNAPKNFCNETTMGWGCGCSSQKPSYNFYEWPINVEDCRKRSLACTAACQNDTTPVEKRAGCNTACNKVYAMQCGTPNQVYYIYEVDKETDIPSYISNNDPGNPTSNATNPTGNNNSNGGDAPSGASIQNPIIWAISALAIVAAGMTTL